MTDETTIPILTDEHVNQRVSMRDAVDAIEGALARKGRDNFVTPPRHYVGTKTGALVFTIGGDAEEGAVGFRVYGIFRGARREDQLVVVYDAASGRLRGIVSGERVGSMRTGALGGVAIRYASREDSKVLALIGSGVQARTQLEAAVVVRDLSEARVFSRKPENRDAFASEMSDALSLNITSVDSPEAAIDGADIVIVATGSPTPVFDGALIQPGMHVTTIRLGATSHELDASVGERASAIFSDSMEQVRNYPNGFFLPARLEGMTDLSDHVARGESIRSSPNDITLYCSAGLAGTEVIVADLALRKV